MVSDKLKIEVSPALLAAAAEAGRETAECLREFIRAWGMACSQVAREINVQFARQPHAPLEDEEKPERD